MGGGGDGGVGGGGGGGGVVSTDSSFPYKTSKKLPFKSGFLPPRSSSPSSSSSSPSSSSSSSSSRCRSRQYFVEILKAKETLRPSVVESVFSSIKAIHSVNQSLLVHVENGYLGRGFEQFCPQLPHYNVYVDNMYDARKVLAAQLKKNRGFRRYKALQEARPEFRDCKLEDLLNLPAQRIHQYKHYLQDLTETTSPEDPEFQQLSGAARAVSEVSCRIQDNARSHQNHLQLLRVQRLLKGRRTKVLAPGRWFIREGWLRRVPTKGVEATPRMFFLFSDMLVQAKRCGPPHGGKFSGQHAYPLQDCTVDKVFGHTRSQGGLLSLSFPKAKLLLMSCDQEDINDWHQSLASAVGKLQSKNTTVHQRDELCRRPLRPAPDPPQNAGPPPATDGPPGRKRNKVSTPQTGRQAGRQADRQTDRQTDRQSQNHTITQSSTHTHTDTHTHARTRAQTNRLHTEIHTHLG
uniref:Rho guanine nucleotide exchange factor (GEF) 39 n=1 Tax=Gadus morhua TaxID=8049 RepID=A0A8C4YZR7_GADMO